MSNNIAYMGDMYAFGNTDRNVQQMGNIKTGGKFEVLLSGSPDDKPKVEGTNKCKGLTYNPAAGELIVKKSESGKATHITNNDIICDNKWDGKNTSLKTALTNAIQKESSGYIAENLRTEAPQGIMEVRSTEFCVDTSADNHVSVSNQYGFILSNIVNGSGRYVARTVLTTDPGGALDYKMQVRNVKTNGDFADNWIRANIAKDGTQTYGVGSPTNFRTAIGAAASSSRLTKENIEDMTYEEAKKILDVNVVSFDYKEGFVTSTDVKDRYYGIIAEDVVDEIPYVVNVPENFSEETFKESAGLNQNLITVDYVNFVPYLIKVIQNQEKRIKELENK